MADDAAQNEPKAPAERIVAGMRIPELNLQALARTTSSRRHQEGARRDADADFLLP